LEDVKNNGGVKMNKIILMLFVAGLILAPSVFAANWYVDNAVATSGNGQSWGTAWKAFSNIAWASVQPGDTIYISGGADSKVYYERLIIRNVHGTLNELITITKGIDPGHNGRVIIDASTQPPGLDQCILIGNDYSYSTDYIKVTGLELRGGSYNIEIKVLAKSILIDNVTVTDWHQFGIMVRGISGNPDSVSGVTIQNSRFIGSTLFGLDALCYNSASNNVIRNNYIHVRNAQVENSHIDGMLAILSEGFMVYNNVIILDSNVQGQAYILRAWADSPTEDPIVVYNNFMYLGGTFNSTEWPWTPALFLRFNPDEIETYGVVRPSTYVIHNTIITGGPYDHGVMFEVPPTVFVNNIVAQFGSGTGKNINESNEWLSAMRNSAGTIYVDDVRNNLIWREWAVNNPHSLFTGTWSGHGTSASNFGWSTWVNTLGGTGVSANPLFADENIGAFGYPVFEDQGNLRGYLQSTSPAINQGEDIRVLVESFGLPWTDINGNPRDGTPTIGAYEYVDGSVTYHPADLNQNGCIDLGEISEYVGLWLNGSGVTLSQVSEGVNEWMKGC
jgi:hypothetical protein